MSNELPTHIDMTNIDEDEVMLAIQNDELCGFCTSCGAERQCIETDAVNYECEECGEHTVIGTHWLLLEMA